MNAARTRLVALVGVMALLTLARPALAQTQSTATVAITQLPDAALSVSIGNTSFGEITYSFTDSAPLPGQFSLTASDTRGTAAGWNVVFAATDFVGAATDDSIPVGNLALAAGTVTTVAGNANTSAPHQGTFAVASASTAGQKIWNASPGYGDGVYTLAVPATLVVPGGTLVDTYTSIVTVSITSGP